MKKELAVLIAGVVFLVAGGQEARAGDVVTTATGQATIYGDSHDTLAPVGGMQQMEFSYAPQDNSISISEFYNRQIPMVGIPGSPETMQDFSPRRNGAAWNEFPPSVGMTFVSGKGATVDTYYKDVYKRIRVAFPRCDHATFVKYEEGKTHGYFMGPMSVLLYPDQGTTDAEAVILAEAFKTGANVIEVISSSVKEESTSEGWHIGFGAGAGGVVGEDEKAAISGAGGTGFGKSKLSRDSLPFMAVRLWRDEAQIQVTADPSAPSALPLAVMPVPAEKKLDPRPDSLKWETIK